MNNSPATAPLELWPGLSIGEQVADGARSQVWKGTYDNKPVAVRRSKRSESSVEWELDLLISLHEAGFVVPTPVMTIDSGLQASGWNVQRWLDGRPPTSREDWLLVSDELQRLHQQFRIHPQRPGCCCVFDLADVRRSVDADLDQIPDEVVNRCLRFFEPYREAKRSVIHGDPHPGNIRMTSDGRVGLLDWDESRIDVCDLDLTNLGQPVLTGDRLLAGEHLANAWEALNGWVTEPGYARSRYEQLPSIEMPNKP